MNHLWQIIKAYRFLLFLIVSCIPIATILQSIQPYLIQKLIDESISLGKADLLFRMSAIYFSVVLSAFLINAIGTYSLQWLATKSLAQLKKKLFDHILHQGQAFFDKRNSGTLLSRITQDVDAIYESLSAGAIGFFSDSLLILGTFGMLIYLSPMLTLISFLVLPVMMYLVNICRKKIGDYFQEIRKVNGELNGYFNEQINGMSTIQNYGAQQRSYHKLSDYSFQYQDLYQKSNWWDAALYAITDGMSSFSIALLLSYCAYLISNGQENAFSLGIIVALIDGINRIYVPIREFSGKLAAIQRSKTAIDKIDELLAVDQKIRFGTQSLTQPQGHIEIKNLSFQYHPQGKKVLDQINLEIKATEVVALVGATGSGKSTISKLILRTYDYEEGDIFFDGENLKDLSYDFISKQICVVHQDPQIFKGTLAQNIALWDSKITQEQIWQAIQQSNLHLLLSTQNQEEILAYPCSANGANLSAGQQQLISIARVFARNPTLVILDEATASIDSITENLIDQAIATLFAQKTVLVIAHRLSTIKKSNRILVLEQGKIVEQGTHQELMLQNQVYAQLIDQKKDLL